MPCRVMTEVRVKVGVGLGSTLAFVAGGNASLQFTFLKEECIIIIGQKNAAVMHSFT